MNRCRVHWLSDFPEHTAVIEAVPGIGNVGKLVVDGLVSTNESELIGMILHPDMPPHATLDSQGILKPSHIAINSVNIGDENIICIGSDAQPMTASGQFEVAEKILQIIDNFSGSTLYVLAGLRMPPESQNIHVVCSDVKMKKHLESQGLESMTGQPESGMIGLAGLLVSLAPMYSVDTIGLVAETIGGAIDASAAERLSMFLEEKFEHKVGMSLDRTQSIAANLLDSVGVSKSAIAEITGEHSHGNLYV